MAKKKQNYRSFYEDKIRYMECSICGTFEENINLEINIENNKDFNIKLIE